MTQKLKVLYLPSTPLNLLVAIAHAEEFKDQQSSLLCLIDQKSIKDNVYFNVLKAWENSVFEAVNILPGLAKGRAKLVERKSNFAQLTKVIDDFKPDAVAVGSDRRVEFQFVMSTCQARGDRVQGWYFDDGLYTYAGRPYVWFKDNVNSLIKKLSYGRWWDEPKTVGASKWIDQAWLFQPDSAVASLQQKSIHYLLAKWFTAKGVLDFGREVLSTYQVDAPALERLKSVGMLVLIPHPNNIKKMVGYEQRLSELIESMREKGVALAVKYHPRTEGKDPLELEKRYDAQVLPSGLAFEFVLPFVNVGLHVVGDIGTALLTAQWLRPDIKVTAVLSKDDMFQQRFKSVYEDLNVDMVESYKALSL